MNAAEHFAEAERLLEYSDELDVSATEQRMALAQAQVHATLAVAASQMRSLPAEQDATS